MKIIGYELIGYKLIERLWGPECRYTVARLDGSHINDVISIPNIKIPEGDLAKLVQARLLALDVLAIPEPSPSIITKESVEQYLKDEGYIKPEQTLEMIKIEMLKVAK
jgi:hypothetical protein